MEPVLADAAPSAEPDTPADQPEGAAAELFAVDCLQPKGKFELEHTAGTFLLRDKKLGKDSEAWDWSSVTAALRLARPGGKTAVVLIGSGNFVVGPKTVRALSFAELPPAVLRRLPTLEEPTGPSVAAHSGTQDGSLLVTARGLAFWRATGALPSFTPWDTIARVADDGVGVREKTLVVTLTSGEAVKFDMIKAELMDALKASIRKQVQAAKGGGAAEQGDGSPEEEGDAKKDDGSEMKDLFGESDDEDDEEDSDYEESGQSTDVSFESDTSSEAEDPAAGEDAVDTAEQKRFRKEAERLEEDAKRDGVYVPKDATRRPKREPETRRPKEPETRRPKEPEHAAPATPAPRTAVCPENETAEKAEKRSRGPENDQPEGEKRPRVE